MSLNETATAAAVKMLEDIEVSLMILFERQQRLIGGNIPYSEERALMTAQCTLLREIYSDVRAVRMTVWAPLLPTVEGAIEGPTVIRCEPVTDGDE